MYALILFKTFAPCELFFNYALLSLEGQYGIFYKFFLILWRRAINSTALNFLKYICQQYDFFFPCQSIWAARTEYPRLGGLNDKHWLLTVLRSSGSKYGDSVSDESPLLGS